MLATGSLTLAGGLWLLHYPLRKPCSENYVHFDLGIPVAVAVVCLLLAAWQAGRAVRPSRRGLVAVALVVVAVVLGAAALVLLHADVAGEFDDCWTF